jgi:hypothetical protein
MQCKGNDVKDHNFLNGESLDRGPGTEFPIRSEKIPRLSQGVPLENRCITPILGLF